MSTDEAEAETGTDPEVAAAGGRAGISVRDTAIVTGCSSGIGRATARALLEDGWRVYATARDPEDIVDLEVEGYETAQLDVTRAEDAHRVVDRVIDETGRVDLLVNNAGYAQLGPLEDVPTDRLRRQFDVNVFGPHRVLRAVLPQMREQGEGRIVTVTGAAGLVSFPGGGAYSGAQAAQEAMGDALRAEVDGMGIDVVLVEPGPVKTSFSDRAERELRALDRTEAYGTFYRFWDDTQTVGGLPAAVTPEEVAETVVEAATCADPAARYQVGRLARLAAVARHLPAGLRDAVYGLLRRLTS